MPYEREQLAPKISRIDGDYSMRLGESKLPRGRRQAIARVDAATHFGHDAHIEFLTNQIFPRSADKANRLRHASFWGIPQKVAAYAYGSAEAKGNVGAVIPANTLLLRGDGVQYATSQETTLSQASQLLEVVCQQAGIVGNCKPGEVLNPAQPIIGITSITASNISNGTDTENTDRLIDRIEARVQHTPQGGSRPDYVRWALEVAGVTRAWAFPMRDPETKLPLGLVAVGFVCDDQQDSIIPDANKVKEVQTYLEYKGPCPGEPLAFALKEKLLNPRIAKLSPDTTVTRKAVVDELIDLLYREAEPATTLPVSHIRASISAAVGEYDHALLFPLEDVVIAADEILVLGAVAWGEDE